jgi:putative membrane protein
MDQYLLIKALHIIALVAWFAGLFYLPRLFVYHSINAKKPDNVKMLRTMEYKLYYYIMHPAMLATVVFGAWLLVLNPAWFQMGWLHAKLTLVALLLVYHFSLAYFLKAFKTSAPKNEKFFRLYNEVPTLLLVVIVLLVVLQPF